jgi:hypothetical protein
MTRVVTFMQTTHVFLCLLQLLGELYIYIYIYILDMLSCLSCRHVGYNVFF